MEVPPDFFLDMILEPSAAAVHARAGVGRVSQDGDADTDGPDWKDLLMAGAQPNDTPARGAAQVSRPWVLIDMHPSIGQGQLTYPDLVAPEA